MPARDDSQRKKPGRSRADRGGDIDDAIAAGNEPFNDQTKRNREQKRAEDEVDKLHVIDSVMAGLVPAIPLRSARLCPLYRDARVKPGHDAGEATAPWSASVPDNRRRDAS